MKNSGFKIKYFPLKNTGFKKDSSTNKWYLSKGTSLLKIKFKNKPLTPKQILDNIVSKCIRLGAADKQGMVQCVTCKFFLHWTKVDCGHFQKRANTSTRYDIKNLGPQCKDCNRFKYGENELFAEFIDKHYGAGTANMLRTQARQIERYFPYEEEIEKWTKVYNKLVEDRSNQIEY